MHELSIAMSLVDLASDELPRLGAHAKIRTVHVRIGALAGVVDEALTFSFDVAAAGSEIAGARLEIEDVPARVFCETCRAERVLANPSELRCAECGNFAPQVVAGRELELVALEVTDDDPDRGSPSEHSQEE
jgi:hydrogenase nickel incorporation protein HypA/HybF